MTWTVSTSKRKMKGETEWPARAGFKELDFVHHSDTFLSFSSNLWLSRHAAKRCTKCSHSMTIPGQTHKLVGTYSYKRMWMEPQACAAWSRSDWHSVTMRLPTFFYNKYLFYEETKNAGAAAECRSFMTDLWSLRHASFSSYPVPTPQTK